MSMTAIHCSNLSYIKSLFVCFFPELDGLDVDSKNALSVLTKGIHQQCTQHSSI